MRRVALIIAAFALLAPVASFAQVPAPQPATAPAARPVKDKKVCKAEEETGSRLGRKTICRTQAEWDELSYRQRQEIERKSRLAPSVPSGG
jgi:hypothetical protein